MKQAVIIQPLIENNRIQLGISYIERALKDVGYEISGVTEEPGNDYRELEGIKIYVGNREESAYLKDLEDRGLLIYHKEIPAEEGFYLNVTAPKLCIVSGGDATGRFTDVWNWQSVSAKRARFRKYWHFRMRRSTG